MRRLGFVWINWNTVGHGSAIVYIPLLHSDVNFVLYIAEFPEICLAEWESSSTILLFFEQFYHRVNSAKLVLCPKSYYRTCTRTPVSSGIFGTSSRYGVETPVPFPPCALALPTRCATPVCSNNDLYTLRAALALSTLLTRFDFNVLSWRIVRPCQETHSPALGL